MMNRVLFSLALLVFGAGPALADPHGDARGGRDGRGGPTPGAMFEGRQRDDRAFEDRRSRGQPYLEGRRDMPFHEEGHLRRPADQDRARAQMRAGEIRPLRDIQRQWRQGMPGYDFLGSDFDAGAGSYRLKFLRDGSVIWIDVDGRTGREIGRRGR